ncbi:hypothetical protein PIB30_073037 [Stylosanthes scabra]|uniref:Uncharacterized protein n=1 Tax=Stylosanthes scabra TaxID=79078 RepID=A0ABU6RP74_9FABA|nr:hypothetical protein [Stylosanthes scabra]
MVDNGGIQATYRHAMYPILGEPLWEKYQFNRPLAPPVKRKPGCLKKKRRKDADEGPLGTASEQEPPLSKIDITRPDYSQPLIVEEELTASVSAPVTWPEKLPLRRIASQPQQHPHMDPMQGENAKTAKRLSEIIRKIPTPGFIPLGRNEQWLMF